MYYTEISKAIPRKKECDLLGLGVSAISLLGDTYAQNQKRIKHYYHDVENSGIALHKGLAMTEEDCLRVM